MIRCTPPGLAGVAVVAFAPSERAEVLRCLRSRNGASFMLAVPPRPQLAALHLDGTAIDEVLVVDRDAGLELHLHGSPAVMAALQARFPTVAAPMSARMQLLADATCPAQLDLALEQLQFRFFDLLAAATMDPVLARAAVARSRAVLAQATPQRVLLAGAQNAGKSTLFNALLGRERALTGPLPGLTRDPVHDMANLDGYPYVLIDTAGEGDGGAEVDRRAIARGRALRAESQVLVVVDLARGPVAADRALLAAHPDALVVGQKQDLPPASWPTDVRCDVRVQCSDVAGGAAAAAAVGRLLRVHRGLPVAGPVGGPAACDLAEFAALRACAADR